MNDSKISHYIQVGHKDLNWYAETEELFVEIFGRPNLKMVATLFAATSMNSSLKSNIRLFRKAHYQIEKGIPHAGFMPGILQQLNRVRDGGELSGNKIRSFAAAMSGDVNAVVVDIWLLRAFGMDNKSKRKLSGRLQSSGATDKQYRLIEQWVRGRAFLLNIEPRQLSAIIWSGARISLDGDRNTRYHEILRHQLYNMFD